MHRYSMQKLIYLNRFLKLVKHWKTRKIFNKTVLRFVDRLGGFLSFWPSPPRWLISMSSWHCADAAWSSYQRPRYISNMIGGQVLGIDMIVIILDPQLGYVSYVRRNFPSQILYQGLDFCVQHPRYMPKPLVY